MPGRPSSRVPMRLTPALAGSRSPAALQPDTHEAHPCRSGDVSRLYPLSVLLPPVHRLTPDTSRLRGRFHLFPSLDRTQHRDPERLLSISQRRAGGLDLRQLG